MTDDLRTPWTLHFDRDGTEDYGIICDAGGDEIVASHICGRDELGKGTFWLPEKDWEPTPVTVRQLRVMTAAPQLLAACKQALAALEAAAEAEHPRADTRTQWQTEPMAILRAAIAEAEG